MDLGLTLGPSGVNDVEHTSTAYGVELSASWGVGGLGVGGGGNGVWWGGDGWSNKLGCWCWGVKKSVVDWGELQKVTLVLGVERACHKYNRVINEIFLFREVRLDEIYKNGQLGKFDWPK
jgi:hypothetical protein